MENLRSATKIDFIGHEYSQLLGSKLPSNKQVLCVFFHNHNTVKLSIRESASLTIRELSVFWAKARIPVRKEQHCITKLEMLHWNWTNLRKNKNKPQQIFRDRENVFIDQLGDLFDIAHSNALSMMKNEVDKAFLLSQREKGRVGCLAGVNFAEVLRDRRKAERSEAEEKRKQRHDEESSLPMEVDLQGIYFSNASVLQ